MRGLGWVVLCLAGPALTGAALVACGAATGAQPGVAPTASAGPTDPSGAAASSAPATPAPIVPDALVAGTDQPPEPGSNEEAIAAVATEFAVSHDAARRCSVLANGALVVEFGASATRDGPCTRNLTEVQRAGSPTGLTIRQLAVDRTGTKATATVTEVGGPRAGATGKWDFAKLTGRGIGATADPRGTWSVVDWEIDYLRSWDSHTLGPGYAPAGPGDPLTDTAVRDCTSRTLQAMSDPEFDGRFYQQFNYADNKRYTVVMGCLEQAVPSDPTRLRTAYEFELIEGLTHGGWSAGESHCAVEKVLGTMTDEQVAKSAVDVPGGPEFAGTLVAAAHGCAGARAPSSA